MDEILQEFLTESAENLDQVERDLVALEETPNSRPLLASIFRNVHTIKGSSGFLGLARLEKVAHAGENLLSALRDGKLVLNAEMTTALLSLIDVLRRMLACLEQTGAESEQDNSTLVAELARLLNGGDASASAEGKPSVGEAPRFDAPVARAPAPPAPAAANASARNEVPSASPGPASKPAAPAPAVQTKPAASAPSADPPASAAAPTENNVRVGIGLLDKLMNLVGELVLARNQVIQISGVREEAALAAASQRLNHVTTELQEQVMKTRLQPINTVWAKFPRVVRDISLDLNKRVRLEMEGKDTELDRTIIEAIKDPLTHIVRNSVDHGIEIPAMRRATGKPEEGVLRLLAYHEGGQVNIEIRDDGKGIDAARVRNKALERGLISAEQAGRMSDRDVLQLVFLPGLSTAEKVTNISGRGVGMDVVKTNIEKIGGAIELFSEPGRGTTIKIKIPLTLAIIPALMVHSGAERYAIPQVSLVELVRLDGDQARRNVETIMGSPVYRLRGQLLPLVRLSEVLKVDRANSGDGTVNIVVLQADGQQFGLVVDRVSDTQEIVVKPLGRHIKNLAVFAGATVLGDGKVALILDVIGLARETRVFSKTRERTLAEQHEVAAVSGEDRKRLLLFTLDEVHRVAIDLSTVGRLEKFPRASVEFAGRREVVQYRDRIMNLIRLSDCLGYDRGGDAGDTLQVIVYSAGGRTVGLVVGRIIDIVEDVVRLQDDGSRAGVLGRAVIQGRVTELLDVPGIVNAAEPALAMAS